MPPKYRNRNIDEETNGRDVCVPVAFSSDSKEEQTQKRNEDLTAKLNDSLELLLEKRGVSRLQGLESLHEAFSLHYQASVDFIAKQPETLGAALVSALKKGDGAVRAIQCLSLVAIFLGDEGARGLAEASPVLAELARDPAKPSDVRVAVLEGAAVMCFMCPEEDEVACWLDIFQDVIAAGRKDSDAELTAEALDSFRLVMSGMSVASSAAYSRHMASWLLLLAHPSLEVRSSAGALLALIFERLQTRGLSEEQVVMLEDTAGAMTDQIKDSSHRKTKSSKKKQRAFFREVLGTLRGEVAEDSVQVGKNKVTVSGWAKVSQLGSLRQLLGSGLLGHLTANPVLIQLFAVDKAQARLPSKECAGDKKIMSLTTRQERTKKNQFLMEEED